MAVEWGWGFNRLFMLMPAREDSDWLQHALTLAQRAAAEGEVPVGAVIIRQGEIVGEGWNKPIGASDPSCHAEIVAIRQACQTTGNYRLPDCQLYSTLEPCVMCAGAIIHSRIAKVVYGATDPKAGAVESVFRVFDEPRLNHCVEYHRSDAVADCSAILTRFFRARRTVPLL